LWQGLADSIRVCWHNPNQQSAASDQQKIQELEVHINWFECEKYILKNYCSLDGGQFEFFRVMLLFAHSAILDDLSVSF
jgi:hypothetical protein